MKKQYRFTMVIIALLSMIGITLLIKAFQPNPVQWEIVEKSSQFELMSVRKINASIEKGDLGIHPGFMFLQNEQLIFYQRGETLLDPNNSLNHMDILTGEIENQKFLEDSISIITNHDDTIYFIHTTYTRPAYSNQTLVRPGSILIMAYDIEKGSDIWFSSYKNVASIDYLHVSDDTIEIKGFQSRGFDRDSIIIDAKTGDLLEEGIDVVQFNRQYITLQTGEEIPYSQAHQLTDHIYILENTSQIRAIDILQQTIIWQKDLPSRLATNIAVSNSVVYYFTREGILSGLDAESGTVLGTIQLEPNEFDGENPVPDYGLPRQTLVADDNTVALYFEETKQLFFFKFEASDVP